MTLVTFIHPPDLLHKNVNYYIFKLLICRKARKSTYRPRLWPMTCTMSSYVRQISAFLEKEN